MRQGLSLFDAAWNTVRKEVGRGKRIPWVTYERMQKGYLFVGEQLVLDPGTYYLAVEAEDREANENLSHAPSIEEAHEQLMASAGHRKHILDARWTHLGVVEVFVRR